MFKKRVAEFIPVDFEDQSNEEQDKMIDEMNAHYKKEQQEKDEKINKLSKQSIDENLTSQERLDASAELAKLVDVEDDTILKDIEDIDAYFQ